MNKVPPPILSKLLQLRLRERLLRLVWGVACVVSLALAVLMVACLVDWLVDMWRETPWPLRLGMFIAQLVVFEVAAVVLILVPLLRPLSQEKLALWAESKRPEFQHRLISALQLNRRGARTEGMSPELLGAMTREAEEQTAPVDFAALADHRRLKRGALILGSMALVAAVLFLFNIPTALALVNRQLLTDVDIPRSLSLASAAPEVFPGGEAVALKFNVRGSGAAARYTGSVRVHDSEGRSFRVPLTMAASEADDNATYVATVPASSANFAYTATLSSSRTRHPGQVFYVPRPSVTSQDAFVILPEYLGYRPDGTCYEKVQVRGDILAMPDLSARVLIKTQKPIVRAVLETFGTAYPDLTDKSGLTRVQQAKVGALGSVSAALMRPGLAGPLGGLGAGAVVAAKIRLHAEEQKFGDPVQEVEWRFKLQPTETSYRVLVFDEYGFSSKTETVRAIRIEPEPAPTVVLHPENFPPGPAFQSRSTALSMMDLEGMPLPLVDGETPGRVRVGYEAYGPYGIGKAQLKIGVIRGANDSEADAKKPRLERWVTLPLAEVPASAREFIKNKGVFEDSTDKDTVPFYAIPTRNATEELPRMFAGGRLDYQPGGILDDSGAPFAFKVDDQVVVYVEVFNRNPDPSKALVGRSRVRERDVVSMERFERWCLDTLQEASRIESLMHMQQQVYDQPWLSIFGGK
jgi:hypothetical protein